MNQRTDGRHGGAKNTRSFKVSTRSRSYTSYPNYGVYQQP